MKKLIAMVMTAAMVASLVPATAFASGEAAASAKIIDALDLTKTQAKDDPEIIPANYDVPELQLKITNANYRTNIDNSDVETEVKLELDNAEWVKGKNMTLDDFDQMVRITQADADNSTTSGAYAYVVKSSAPSGTYLIDSSVSTSTTDSDLVVKVSDLKAVTGFKEVVTWLEGNHATFSLDAGSRGDTLEVTAADGTKTTYTSDGTDWKDGSTTLVGADLAAAIKAGATIDKYTVLKATLTGTTDYATGAAIANNATIPVTDIIAVTYSGWHYGEYEKDSSTTASSRDTLELTAIDDLSADSVTLVFTGKFAKDDIVNIELRSVLDKKGINKYATVSVDGDLCSVDDMVYVSVLSQGLTASTKKVGTVAVEEVANLEKDLKIESTVGKFYENQEFTLRLSSGFEFTNKTTENAKNDASFTPDYEIFDVKDNEATLKYTGTTPTDEITVRATDIEIEAVSAKEGATCTMTVKSVKDSAVTNSFAETAKVEVLKVVEYEVVMSVDEDDDVPVIYSGVNVKNDYITDDSDHLSLEVTIEETFPGAWSFNKAFDLELPEGVYVTGIEVTDADNFDQNAGNVDVEEAWEQAFFDAYQKGEHEKFEFKKRVFDNTKVDLNDEEATLSFQLELVADPTFVGDVTLKLTGDAFDEAQEVTIAKFVKPYTVKAEQNDLKIDYRYTEVPTEIVVTEAEGGLWKKGAEFAVYVEKPNYIVFEDDPTFTVDKNSGMELTKDELNDSKDWTGNGGDGFDAIHFTVDKTSDEAATITISDLKLFMDRTIPAGAYALKGWTNMAEKYEAQAIFAPDCQTTYPGSCTHSYTTTNRTDDCFVGDVCDYSKVVKEAFVNVVTAGREQDDASFTTKVVVPVGESKIVAGETEYTIDAPAYINANGYTMLPVRAVAVALGINNNNVLWDQATKTVTILYGQRIITMQVGASVVYVNGAALPASSSVEITNNRTFLGLRDLATALGVTDITWDASTKTATLNGGNTAE